MQKGGGDADDGLNPAPQSSGAPVGGANGASSLLSSAQTPAVVSVVQPPPAGPSSAALPQISPVPQLVLAGSLQTEGTAPNVVCPPQTGLPPQLRGLIAHTTGYRPLHPHSLASATLPTQLLGSPGLGRRVFSPTTAAIVTCAGVLSPALSPHSATILASHTFHRQLGGAGGAISGGRALPQQQSVPGQPVGTTGFLVGSDSVSLPGNTSISASGGTIHHHGQSPTRGGLPPLASPSGSVGGASVPSTSQSHSRHARETITSQSPASSNLSRNVFEGLTKSLAATTTFGPSPRKRPRVEEKPAATPEIAHQRKLILDSKYKDMGEIRKAYIEHLTELFFLQNGGNIMDYLAWKKRPTPQLVHFLKSGNLDSDEEDDHQIQVKTYNDEVKVLTGAGSNIPLSTPVAISKTLPPNVTALNQGSVNTVNQGPTSLSQTVPGLTTAESPALTTATVTSSAPSSLSITTTASTTSASGSKPISSPLSPPANLHSQLAKCIASLNASQIKTALTTSISNGSPKARLSVSKKHSLSSMCASPLGSQEAIVERAKQEAQVMQRVSELRKEGMWSSRRLPRVQEPPRNKAHWDYLLEEMQWLATDFAQERKWKKAGARKIARMVAKYHQEVHQREIRAEKEEAMKLRRIASQLAKQIKEFWTNIEKVVQYKQQSRLEEKRKKALDLHLNFIVDQTEKYSTWLTEGLTGGSTAGSVASDTTSDQAHTSGDEDFQPAQEDSDDEETIEREEQEAGTDEKSTLEEVEALQKESEVPIEELIKTIPHEVFSKPASLADESEEVDVEGDGDLSPLRDEEFEAASDEDEQDLEETIEEQEKHEKKADRKKEIDELQQEGEMSMEELVEKYAGAYDSDFEFPNESTDDETDDESEAETEVEEEEEEESEEEVEDEPEGETTQEDVGLEYLMHPEAKEDVDIAVKKEPEAEGPGKEITDIAAEALSLQPKGYTLQTTEVKTKVPFLLKHKLREYQHVGLNWLATMYEKRLNGILADEMGLGKTIQTIALLAHLACEKGVWGPHLIVVPTSVMLNWEMEIKKWCPAFKILTYYGNQKERKQKRQGWTKTNAFHICITSYKLVIQDHQSFRRKKWKYFILDEAQNIKNFKSQRWQTLLNFSSQRRLLLTGTPLQNSLMELWSLMHFLMPHVFQSHKEFKEWFSNPLSGMIEGSHEYNDSLIRRLHKVLRPFLLRRLKDDVEKQMPKKYEHVVMCKLSKRQRYLYDDFMSQTKTRETLSSGHFMSVINILMQLRKVCNHPNLFDPRPIVSPFQMEGIVCQVPSKVLQALEYNPFTMIDIRTLFPSLVDMEKDLPAFVAHRVKKLQTPHQLIVEIDSQPDPPPRLKPAKKPVVFRSVSPLVQSVSGRSSPLAAAVSPSIAGQNRPASPITIVRTAPAVVRTQQTPSPVPIKLGVSATQPVQLQRLGASPVATAVVQPVAPNTVVLSTPGTRVPTSHVTTVQGTLAAKLPTIPGSAVLTSSGTQVIPSQPITVQIQQTDQGTQLMIPSGQLSQLPAGFIQIVQTSTGQQLITTTGPSAAVPQTIQVTPRPAMTSAPTTPLVNGVPSAALPTVVGVSQPATTAAGVTPVRVTSLVQQSTPAANPLTPTLTTVNKPVMRVSPLTVQSPATPKPYPTATATLASTSATPTVISKTLSDSPSTPAVTKAAVKPVVRARVKPKSEFDLTELEKRRSKCRREKLELISKLNKRHCDVKPVYGQDFYNCVNLLRDGEQTGATGTQWKGRGFIHCHNVQHCKRPHRMANYLARTEALSQLVHTPEQYLSQLQDILQRYVFVTPVVVAPPVSLNAPHPSPSYLVSEVTRKEYLHRELSPRVDCLHSISSKMTVTFPELRLIQYDCGKLQTLDILLRDLKSGDHRVLIFTQMTKMLHVLEAFLNYHGHRYLRLDGTTKVEQRQALMERFNADRRIFCFILSTRSGGLGINLTGADTVIFYDSDWNPTMDAQAQDRCHRIGQTRDVHIYRLISEKTIEENILKKANQKRLLGDLAIEGGNFTTAFFKEQTLKDLFEEPSGLDQLAKEKAETLERKQSRARAIAAVELPGSEGETKNIVAKFEEALCKAEDETDVIAANQVRAEQKAELAEFDENIPWDEKEDRRQEEDDVSKVEQELAMLEKELTPVERYAVMYMESQLEPYNVEELEIAEEEVELAKNSWELARLKALKEEEERRAEWEEDEMLFTYSREDSYNQVFVSDTDGDQMPLWAPPTPPQDDNDLYIDQTIFFMYEPMPMTETQLPPVYVKKETRKTKVETMSRRLLQKQSSSDASAQLQARKLKQRKEEAPRVPRSLFERPTATIVKLRKEAKLQKLKQGLIRPFRQLPASSNKPVMDITPDHPEWLIHEDWALLQAVQTLLYLPLNLMIVSPAHIPNWDLVSDVVNSCSRVYRSPKQCKLRYENVIIAREEGRILYDINPRKQKKSKGIYKDLPVVSSSYSSTQTKNNRPMKTSQLFLQDNQNSVTMLHSLRFDSIKCIAGKRTPTLRPTLVNPTQKNPKHAAVLAESGITYDTPLNPEKVAAIRAERIQQEKKKGQVMMMKAQTDQLAAQRTQAQQASAASTAAAQVATQLQTAATAAANVLQTGALQKPGVSPGTVPAVSITRPGGSTSNIVVNTAPGVSGTTFAAINKRMSQQTGALAQPSTVKTLSPQTVSQAVRGQRTVQGTALTMQELTTAVNQAQAQAQARANLTSGTATVVTTASLTAAQLAAQRTVASATSVTGVTSVQQQLSQGSKPLTQAQLSHLRQQQQTILKPNALHPRQILTQKIPFNEMRRQQLKQQQQQQQIRQQLQQGQTGAHQLHVASGQKPVLTSQLVTAIGQKTPVKPIQRLTEAEVQALIKRQQAYNKQSTAGHVQQIIAPVQQVGQASSAQSPVATLVKTVSAPCVSSVTIPVTQVGPVNINVSMTGQKTATGKNLTVNQLHQQQKLNHFRLLQRNLHPAKMGVAQQVTGKGQVPLGAIQINRPLPTITLQQFVKQQQQQNQGATIQQIITSVAPSTQTTQPTLIATVTQAQPMVAKVSLATAPATTQMQAITQASSLTLGSQVSVTTQPSVATLSLTAASPQSTPTGVVQSVNVTSAGSPTVQMQPLQTVSVGQAKLTNIAHAVPQARVTQVVHQQVQPSQVTGIGRTHTIAAQTPPVAAQQVVVTAATDSPQIQAQIQRATASALLASQAPAAATQQAAPATAPHTVTLASVGQQAQPAQVAQQQTVQAQPLTQTLPVLSQAQAVATPGTASPQVTPHVVTPATPQTVQQQQQQQQQTPAKTPHYAMRSRTTHKH
ncbi:helicase SRCAP-like isoform X3 [Liolophura sinensis]|uniref:helicase SRCAP-like isoform X3 n=1 Tax=Liolophura sinensis TaxID=3198878 RepID=UPI00315963F5